MIGSGASSGGEGLVPLSVLQGLLQDLGQPAKWARALAERRRLGSDLFKRYAK